MEDLLKEIGTPQLAVIIIISFLIIGFFVKLISTRIEKNHDKLVNKMEDLSGELHEFRKEFAIDRTKQELLEDKQKGTEKDIRAIKNDVQDFRECTNTRLADHETRIQLIEAK